MKFAAITLTLAMAATAAVPTKYHEPADAGAPIGAWWTTLHDPELTSLIERAVRANLDLKIATSRILEARAARRIARADLLPSVSSANTVEHLRGGISQGLPKPFDSNVYQFGFDSSWEIDLFGGRRHALAAATADVAAIEEARRDTLVTLLAEVARNYSELRGLQRRLGITNENIQLQADSLHLTEVRADAGLGTRLDVERQAAQLESTRALVPALETSEIQTIHRISVLLGEEPASLLDELNASKPLPAAPPTVPAGLPADLLKRRPDVREAAARIDAETARVGVAHADLFPKIVLTGAAGRVGTGASPLTLGAANFFAFGPSITLPMFTAGKIHANIEAQKQRLDQATIQYQNTVLHSLEETENALAAYDREKERRERLVAAVEASREATRLADEVYTRGLADFLTVLDAQRQQLAAEDDLARSDTAVVTNLVAVYKALGGGWVVPH